jgi:hypothetical protein
MNSKTLTARGLAVALLALASAGRAAEPTKIPIRFTTPGKGQLSLGVYDDSGTLIRSLTYASEVGGGKQTLEWDGTTDLGLPARPGAYSTRGIWFAEPLKANFKIKVGISGDPPYVLDNGLGGWGGNLGSPMDVCSDGNRVVAAFACVESPNVTGVQLMDETRRIVRRYFTFFPWDVRYACAMDDTNMYLALASIGEKNWWWRSTTTTTRVARSLPESVPRPTAAWAPPRTRPTRPAFSATAASTSWSSGARCISGAATRW